MSIRKLPEKGELTLHGASFFLALLLYFLLLALELLEIDNLLLGQILLNPIVNILEKEVWLWKNQSALDSLKRGLKEAEAGET